MVTKPVIARMRGLTGSAARGAGTATTVRRTAAATKRAAVCIGVAYASGGGLTRFVSIGYDWGSCLAPIAPAGGARLRSSVAQWQSIRLLTGGLLVRVQPEEPYLPSPIDTRLTRSARQWRTGSPRPLRITATLGA